MKPNKILICYGLKQLFKTPVKAVSMLVVSIVLCAFLSISLNLRQVAQENLQLLKEEFDVVAIPTFKGSVDKQGNLTTNTDSANYQGYVRIFAQDFDISTLENATGVKDILIHKQFGGYLNSEQELIPGEPISNRYNTYDVFIFTYTGQKEVTLRRKELTRVVGSIDWSARGYHELENDGVEMYNLADFRLAGSDEMWLENVLGHKTGEVILQPGKQYIAFGKWSFVISKDGYGKYMRGRDKLSWVTLGPDEGHSKQEIYYENGGFVAEQDPTAYQVTFPYIMPYTENFWETEAGAYYQDAIDICRVNGSTLTVVATEDLSLYQPFYNGGVYITEGRNFFTDDHENGNKVCLVSKYLAELNDWQIGDKLDLSFFEATYSYNNKSVDVTSYYEPLKESYDEATGNYSLDMVEGFFDKGQYEIIGFYDGKVTKSEFKNNIQYTKTEGIDRRIIIVPQASVTNHPDVPLSEYNTTILLDDEQIMYFMSDMEASGLLEQKKGQYQVSFEIFDQGLGAIKQSLRQLDTVSRLTLYLACAAAVVVIVLLAVLTVLQNHRQIATLRSLGVRKGQIPAAVLSGVLLVCLIGAIAGGVLGHVLSDRVAEYILDTAQMDLADTSFTAMLAKEDVEEEDLYAIAIQSQPKTAIFASAAVWGALTLLCCILVLPEASKSPMLTLGAKE